MLRLTRKMPRRCRQMMKQARPTNSAERTRQRRPTKGMRWCPCPLGTRRSVSGPTWARPRATTKCPPPKITVKQQLTWPCRSRERYRRVKRNRSRNSTNLQQHRMTHSYLESSLSQITRRTAASSRCLVSCSRVSVGSSQPMMRLVLGSLAHQIQQPRSNQLWSSERTGCRMDSSQGPKTEACVRATRIESRPARITGATDAAWAIPLTTSRATLTGLLSPDPPSLSRTSTMCQSSWGSQWQEALRCRRTRKPRIIKHLPHRNYPNLRTKQKPTSTLSQLCIRRIKTQI